MMTLNLKPEGRIKFNLVQNVFNSKRMNNPNFGLYILYIQNIQIKNAGKKSNASLYEYNELVNGCCQWVEIGQKKGV